MASLVSYSVDFNQQKIELIFDEAVLALSPRFFFCQNVPSYAAGPFVAFTTDLPYSINGSDPKQVTVSLGYSQELTRLVATSGLFKLPENTYLALPNPQTVRFVSGNPFQIVPQSSAMEASSVVVQSNAPEIVRWTYRNEYITLTFTQAVDATTADISRMLVGGRSFQDSLLTPNTGYVYQMTLTLGPVDRAALAASSTIVYPRTLRLLFGAVTNIVGVQNLIKEYQEVNVSTYYQGNSVGSISGATVNSGNAVSWGRGNVMLFGNAGQSLTSQGSNRPPIWEIPGSGLDSIAAANARIRVDPPSGQGVVTVAADRTGGQWSGGANILPRDIFFGGTDSVYTGLAAGNILSFPQGRQDINSWNSRRSAGESRTITALICNDSVSPPRYVMVGERGTVRWGERLDRFRITWNDVSSITARNLNAVAYGSDITTYVAVGTGGAAIYSTDGAETWQTADSRVSLAFYGVAYGQVMGSGLFVAVGQLGTLATSPDGVIWTRLISGVTINLYAVFIYNGTILVGGGPNTSAVLLISTDGVNYMPRAVGAGTNTPLRGFALGHDGIYAGGGFGSTNYILRSTDLGQTWASRYTSTSNYSWIDKITWNGQTSSGNIRYLAAGPTTSTGANPVFLQSLDGNTWSTISTFTEYNFPINTQAYRQVTGGIIIDPTSPNLITTVTSYVNSTGGGIRNQVLYTFPGISWAATSSGNIQFEMTQVIYHSQSDRFIASLSNGIATISSTGNLLEPNWQRANLSLNTRFFDMDYDAASGNILAVGGQRDTIESSTQNLQWSPDGTNWNRANATSNTHGLLTAFNNDANVWVVIKEGYQRFIVAGQSISSTSRADGITEYKWPIIFDPAEFVPNPGTVFTVTGAQNAAFNGPVFTVDSYDSSITPYPILTTSSSQISQLFTVGGNPYLTFEKQSFNTRDFVVWNQGVLSTFATVYAMAYCNGAFVLLLGTLAITTNIYDLRRSTDNGLTWSTVPSSNFFNNGASSTVAFIKRVRDDTGTERFYAGATVGDQSEARAWYSDDGLTWRVKIFRYAVRGLYQVSFSNANFVQGLYYLDNLWILNVQGTIFYSFDFEEWFPRVNVPFPSSSGTDYYFRRPGMISNDKIGNDQAFFMYSTTTNSFTSNPAFSYTRWGWSNIYTLTSGQRMEYLGNSSTLLSIGYDGANWAMAGANSTLMLSNDDLVEFHDTRISNTANAEITKIFYEPTADVWYSVGSNVVAGGVGSNIWRTSNVWNNTWQTYANFPTNSRANLELFDLLVEEGNHIAVGRANILFSNNGVDFTQLGGNTVAAVVRHLDGGNIYTDVPYLKSLTALSLAEDRYWVTGSNNRIAHSRDGTLWNHVGPSYQANLTFYNVSNISFSTGPVPNRIVAFGENNWIASNDLGQTWSNIGTDAFTPLPTNMSWRRITAGSSNVAVFGYYPNAQPTLWTSNNGDRWTEVNLPPSASNVREITYFSDSILVVGGDSVSYSTNNGASYTTVSIPNVTCGARANSSLQSYYVGTSTGNIWAMIPSQSTTWYEIPRYSAAIPTLSGTRIDPTGNITRMEPTPQGTVSWVASDGSMGTARSFGPGAAYSNGAPLTGAWAFRSGAGSPLNDISTTATTMQAVRNYNSSQPTAVTNVSNYDTPISNTNYSSGQTSTYPFEGISITARCITDDGRYLYTDSGIFLLGSPIAPTGWLRSTAGTLNLSLSSLTDCVQAFGYIWLAGTNYLGRAFETNPGICRLLGVTPTITRSVSLGNRIIAVGSGGALLISDDGTNFRSANVATNYTVRDVTYGNGIVLAAGENSQVYRSFDRGDTWLPTSQSLPIGPVRDLGFISNTWVMVGNSNLAYSSTGISWVPIYNQLGSNTDLRAVGNIGNRFVLGGTDSTLFYSDDLLSYTPAVVPGGQAVTFAYSYTDQPVFDSLANTFSWTVTVTDPRFAGSANIITALEAPIYDSSNVIIGNRTISANISSISSNALVTNGYDLIFFTQEQSNAATVTANTQISSQTPAAYIFTEISRANANLTVLGTSLGNIFTTDNGVDYTQRFSAVIPEPIQDTAYHDNIWYALSTRSLFSSADAVTWKSLMTFQDTTFEAWDSTQISPSIVVLAGNTGTAGIIKVSSTPDGNIYPTVFTDPRIFYGVTESLGLVVAVGARSNTANAVIAVSNSQGQTWQLVESNFPGNLTAVRYLRDRFYATGNAGTILNSTDGMTWANSLSPVSDLNSTFLDINYSSNSSMYVAVTDRGNILYSSDSNVWSYGSNVVAPSRPGSGTPNAALRTVLVNFSGNFYVFPDQVQHNRVYVSNGGVTWASNIVGANDNNGTPGYINFAPNNIGIDYFRPMRMRYDRPMDIFYHFYMGGSRTASTTLGYAVSNSTANNFTFLTLGGVIGTNQPAGGLTTQEYQGVFKVWPRGGRVYNLSNVSNTQTWTWNITGSPTNMETMLADGNAVYMYPGYSGTAGQAMMLDIANQQISQVTARAENNSSYAISQVVRGPDDLYYAVYLNRNGNDRSYGGGPSEIRMSRGPTPLNANVFVRSLEYNSLWYARTRIAVNQIRIAASRSVLVNSAYALGASGVNTSYDRSKAWVDNTWYSIVPFTSWPAITSGINGTAGRVVYGNGHFGITTVSGETAGALYFTTDGLNFISRSLPLQGSLYNSNDRRVALSWRFTYSPARDRWVFATRNAFGTSYDPSPFSYWSNDLGITFTAVGSRTGQASTDSYRGSVSVVANDIIGGIGNTVVTIGETYQRSYFGGSGPTYYFYPERIRESDNISYDAGDSWTTLPSIGNDMTSIRAYRYQGRYVILNAPGNYQRRSPGSGPWTYPGLIFSHDGLNWEARYFVSGFWAYDLTFSNDRWGYASGTFRNSTTGGQWTQPGVLTYISTNQGNSWDIYRPPYIYNASQTVSTNPYYSPVQYPTNRNWQQPSLGADSYGSDEVVLGNAFVAGGGGGALAYLQTPYSAQYGAVSIPPIGSPNILPSYDSSVEKIIYVNNRYIAIGAPGLVAVGNVGNIDLNIYNTSADNPTAVTRGNYKFLGGSSYYGAFGLWTRID